MEGGSLFNPGFLGGSFLWWIGQIADDSTWRDNILTGKFSNKDTIPGWGRRYKVRIVGLHDQGETVIPSDQLPWAQVMYPVTGGGGQTNAGQTANLRQGMMVFGFFMDGQDQQIPVIMGVIGNNAQTNLSNRIGDNSVTNEQPGSLAKSGYSTGAVPKEGPTKEIVPDEGLVIEKPKDPNQQLECASPPPGSTVNEYGLRADLPLSKEQFADAQSARAEADQRGITGTERTNYIQQKVAEGIKNRCAQASSPNSPAKPGATKENVDAVHQLSAADVKREDKYREKIVLLKPDNLTQSAINGIQTVLDNLTEKVSKYLNSLQSYVDAVSSIIDDIDRIIRNAACEIAKYIKILFNKIMEYVLKLLNQQTTNAVSATPSSMRHMFADIKTILTELILKLYNELTENLCDAVQGILNDVLDLDNLESQARERATSLDQGILSSPSVPICYAEDISGKILSASREKIDTANNSILDNLNYFLNDIQEQLAGVTDDLADITSLIGNITGSLTSALNFENIKLNVFGFELSPNVAVADFYTFANGGEGQPDSQLPSAKAVEESASRPANIKSTPNVPFAEPSKDQPNINLGVDSSSQEQTAQTTP